jgi:hypothetical protein
MSGGLSRAFAEAARLARAAWRRFVEYCVLDDSQSRGLALLKEWLTPEQLAQYETSGHFDVIGCHSGRRYRIRHGTGMNIYELDELGRLHAGWCFVPRDTLVAGDVMLAQKIALEANERSALAVARSFPVRWRPT